MTKAETGRHSEARGGGCRVAPGDTAACHAALPLLSSSFSDLYSGSLAKSVRNGQLWSVFDCDHEWTLTDTEWRWRERRQTGSLRYSRLGNRRYDEVRFHTLSSLCPVYHGFL